MTLFVTYSIYEKKKPRVHLNFDVSVCFGGMM